jgi:enoyl-CoA hydratase/carnithine racemase
MTQTDKVIARKDGRIGYIVFNNPQRHNAMSLEMWEATRAILDDYAGDTGVRVVVLTGAGSKAFISGADISKFGAERATQDAVARYNAVTEQAYAGVHDFPKPTIAMIRGYCIGGGLGLAASCDMRIASDNARFAVPAARLGLGYDYPGLKRLIDVVGPSFAKEIFFTARQFDAEEARGMGLANRVVPDAQLENFVKGYADTIAANAPLTIGSVKFIVGQALRDAHDRDMDAIAASVKRCFDSRDYVEGRTAFMEKRKPDFTGT